jgi:hypothetical protein
MAGSQRLQVHLKSTRPAACSPSASWPAARASRPRLCATTKNSACSPHRPGSPGSAAILNRRPGSSPPSCSTATRGSPSPSRKPSWHRARARLAGGSSRSASSRNLMSRSPGRRPPAKPSATGCAAPTRTSRNAPTSTPASPPGSPASHCHDPSAVARPTIPRGDRQLQRVTTAGSRMKAAPAAAESRPCCYRNVPEAGRAASAATVTGGGHGWHTRHRGQWDGQGRVGDSPR